MAWHGSESGRAGALVGMLAWQLKSGRVARYRDAWFYYSSGAIRQLHGHRR